MLVFLQKVSRLLTTYTPWFIIAVALLAFVMPPLFSWVAGYTQTALLGFIMLTMGLTLTTADFKALASRPWDIALGAFAQYTLMPLIAFSLTRLFHLDTALSVGIVLVGCCPGGVSSNIMSYLCKGDVAFSVGMTTVSTLLAPLATPALVLLIVGEKIEVDAVGMFVNILIVTIIPVAAGFLLNLLLGARDSFRKIQSVMPAFSVLALACILSMGSLGDTILTFAFMSMGLRAAAVFASLCAALFFPGRVDRKWAAASIVVGPVAVFAGKLMGLPFDSLFLGVGVGIVLILIGAAAKKKKKES